MSESNQPQEQQVDEAAQAEAMRRLREELAASPAGEVVAQAAAHLATFAYVRLGIPPEPNQRYRDLAAARVLIDAFGGLIGAVQGSLGEVEGELQEALAALRMTYASVSGGAPPAGAEQPPPAKEEPGLHRPSGLWVPGQD
jgi:Domain of unknown function (DUF1844)